MIISCASGSLALVVALARHRPQPAIRRAALEASGFVGVDYFGDDIELGNSLAPEQRPQTAPVARRAG